ncbi:MAG: hypothetical protein ACYTGH_10215, partial [Planctomycetota bacterium]
FNEAIRTYVQQPFQLGVLYADRALRYKELLKVASVERSQGGDGEERMRRSGDRAFAAAVTHLGKAKRDAQEMRMARFNQGTLLWLHFERGITPDMATKAIGLLRQSLRLKVKDVWALRARQLIEELSATLPAPALQAPSESHPSTAPKIASSGRADETGLLQRLLNMARRPGGHHG